MSVARFGVTRPVPVNILMFLLLVGGLFAASTLTKEFFPESSPESATVSLIYPGATPEEIEETLVRKVEDAISDLDEVERVQASISEGGGSIIVEFREGVRDVTKATDEVERQIDALQDLPEDAERIRVAEFEPQLPVIMLNLFGQADEEALKRTVRRMRDELRMLPGMGETILSGVRDYEIRVDVEAGALLEHRLSLPEISRVIGTWMADVPGGTVRSDVGNINIRTLGVKERAEAIRNIVVVATTDGQMLRVGDIARVQETYVDEQIKTRFRAADTGGPAASLTVYKVGDQDAVEIAEMVRAYAQGRRYAAGTEDAAFEPYWTDRLLALLSKGRPGAPMTTPRREAFDLGASSAVPMPVGCDLAISSDLARFIEGRLDLLIRNAKYGALLVIATLVIFLNWRTAWWVTVGLATALGGTIIFMSVTGVTLNLLTMFGLIIVIGLLVDDAIVVAENITARHDAGEPAFAAAIKGTDQVLWPVVATVLTSVVAFLPLTFVRGQIGDLLGALPWVVACALAMSLVESIFILPSHLAHSLVVRDQAHETRRSIFERYEAWRDRIINDRIIPAYGKVLEFVLRERYVSLAVALFVLIATFGMVAGGRLDFVFIPESDSETIIVELKMPIGTPLAETERVVTLLEQAAARQPEMKSTSTLIGVQANVDDTSGVTSAGQGTHLGQLFVELVAVEVRQANGERESSDVIAAIRDEFGVVEGVESLRFSEIQGGPGGADITVRVSGEDPATVEEAVRAVRGMLATVDGVVDIADDNARGQREVQIDLNPGAASLGLTVADVATQVRGALFGLDAHVFSERREDIDVRVRLDETSRANLGAIERLWLLNPEGRRIPLGEVARLTEGQSYNSIRRVDGRRSISVTADTRPGLSPESVVEGIVPNLDEVARDFPGVYVELAGRQRELRKAFESLPLGFGVALILIYVILAWLFGSYVQPIAVMMAVPFATIGAIWGHSIMGYDLTFLSIIGFVALSGIVVNDSLILVQFFNRQVDAGLDVTSALIASGRQRLRPIMLTTITTVLGLTPLMLERSFQAKFLIPMAVSIAFGLMSATVLILLVLPAMIRIVEDVKNVGFYLWNGRPRSAREVSSAVMDALEGE